MNTTARRTFLKLLGASGVGAVVAGAPWMDALATPPSSADESEYFLFVHAAGGWDVTLWADPRNERRGLIEPASSDNTDRAPIRRWVDAPLDADTQTFQPVTPSGSAITFGPAIGNLGDMADRLCVINGLAMNTVSHMDGTVFSATGRHLVGGRAVASSVDTMVANEFGRGQILPLVSVRYPSSYVGGGLDPRVIPLRVGGVDTLARSLARSDRDETADDRADVTALLSREASDLARQAQYPEAFDGMRAQFGALQQMLGGGLQSAFRVDLLRAAYPRLDYRGRYHGGGAVNVAFAVEAFKRNLARCVSVAFGGFDTHNGNYRNHAATLQELFDLLAALIRTLDETPHPTRRGDRLADHTHVLVVSDFCRTPQVNMSQGRDHYPNNSALIISPRFRANRVFGRTDAEQLLPADAGRFRDGARPVAPPDVLATFLAAFGVEPRRYLRDGEIVRELLRS